MYGWKQKINALYVGRLVLSKYIYACCSLKKGEKSINESFMQSKINKIRFTSN